MSTALRSASRAVVRAADGIRLTISSDHPEKIAQELADYVSERCDDVLWPNDASQVRALLEDRNLVEAVTLYFDRVGDRWDEEELELCP